MIHTKHGVRCERCFREEADLDAEARRRLQGASGKVLQALMKGPLSLGALSIEVYHVDSPAFRRRISSLLRQLGNAVESVDGKGTWRLADKENAA